LIFIFILIASAGGEEKVDVKANSVLKLNLNYEIPEQSQDNPFATFDLSTMKSHTAVGLTDIIKSIRKAKEDKNIKGIYLDMAINPNGYATLGAIRNELADFKKSGKFVYAYGDMVSQKAYYLASVSDKIYVNPNGFFELRGFGREITYYKGMFDKLGIEVQDFHCGQYKSAIEPFIRTDMSEANRAQLLYLYGEVYNQFVTSLSQGRKIDTATLGSIINEMKAETPEKAVELKLIDGAWYYDQVVTAMKEKAGLGKDDKLPLTPVSSYYKTLDKEAVTGDRIAVLYAEGEIVDGEGDKGEIGGDAFAKQIEKLRKDEKVKAIVLRVNSPGGSALASDVMWRELMLAKKEKPLVVSFGNVAASGGYYISCMADRIYAEPNTITGSIGVFGLIPNAKKLFNEKLGITFDEVELNKHGVFGGGTKPLDAEESAMAQRNVEKTYREFKERVAEGRKQDTAYIETIAQGRVWTGTQAIKNKLVDELGNLDDAIAYAAKQAKLKDYKVKNYPEQQDWMTELSKNFEGSEERMIAKKLGDQYKFYKTIEQLRKMTGTQMRMVYDLGL
jgi:protease-4